MIAAGVTACKALAYARDWVAEKAQNRDETEDVEFNQLYIRLATDSIDPESQGDAIQVTSLRQAQTVGGVVELSTGTQDLCQKLLVELHSSRFVVIIADPLEKPCSSILDSVTEIVSGLDLVSTAILIHRWRSIERVPQGNDGLIKPHSMTLDSCSTVILPNKDFRGEEADGLDSALILQQLAPRLREFSTANLGEQIMGRFKKNQ